MVIELSGEQFGLKSYARFHNQASALREFDLESQVWFQIKIVRHEVQLPLYYNHFEITQFFITTNDNVMSQNSLVRKRKWLVLPYIFLQSDWLVQVSHEIWLVSIIAFSFWLAKKNSAIRE